MRPDTIEKALEFVQEELNTMYLQQRSDPPRSHYNARNAPAMTPFLPQPRPLAFQNHLPFQPVPQNSKFAPAPRQAFRHNPIQMMQPQPRMPTRIQQMFSAPPPNYNPRSNVFKLPPRNFNQNQNNQDRQGPQPMSGVSHFVSKALPPRLVTQGLGM